MIEWNSASQILEASDANYQLKQLNRICTFFQLKPLQSLYKQVIKRLDKKPNRSHHCPILKKDNMLSWDNMIKYANMCLMYKVINNLTSPPLKEFVQVRTSAYHSTRSAERGDCIIPLRKSRFGQSTFSHKAAQDWNTIPAPIRELDSHQSFKFYLK